MSKTINQHYVPQFLLNRFGTPTKVAYQINTYNKKTKKYRQDIVENVFSQNHFYDKNNEVEDYLAQLERNTSPIINKIIDEHVLLTVSEKNTLLQFISCQYARTLPMRNEMNKIIDDQQMAIVKSIFEANKHLSPFNEMYATGEIDHGEFRYNRDDKRTISSANVENSKSYYHSIEDLELHLLKNNTQDEFIVGDQPVVLCNWLLSGYQLTKNIPINSSLMALGAQLFMPLSPKLCLCLYDNQVYKYGSKSESITNINDQSVNWLNTLQVIYASDTIGFKSDTMKQTVYSLINKFEHRNLRKSHNYSHQHQVSCGFTLTNLEPRPNFFKILDKAKNLPDRAIKNDKISLDNLVSPHLLYRKAS